MKKFLLFLMLLSFCFSLTCCKKADELGKNAVITSFFVDVNEDGLYEISCKIMGFSQDEKIYIKSASDETIKGAYYSLLKNIEKSPYIGHADILVLGDGICIKGISDTISFFSDINGISPNINLIISEYKAAELSETSINENLKTGRITNIPIYSLFIPENETVAIPVVKGENNEIYPIGIAIFENMKFVSYISESEYEIYKLLLNNYNQSYFSDFEIINSKCKLLDFNGNLKIELNMAIKNLTDKKETEISSELENEIYKFISKLKKQKLLKLLKKENFNDFSSEIQITALDTGKIKGE